MCQTAKNRVVRVTAGYQGSPDQADPASQVILLDDIDNDAGSHNAGWLGFGPLDGKLYVSVGDGGLIHTKAQDLGSLDGKILRLNADGTVPLDNPFVGQFGARPEVWALGFRNPWRCRFHPDGRLFCGDVGEQTSEELDVVVKGGNYGWPDDRGQVRLRHDAAVRAAAVRRTFTTCSTARPARAGRSPWAISARRRASRQPTGRPSSSPTTRRAGFTTCSSPPTASRWRRTMPTSSPPTWAV